MTVHDKTYTIERADSMQIIEHVHHDNGQSKKASHNGNGHNGNGSKGSRPNLAIISMIRDGSPKEKTMANQIISYWLEGVSDEDRRERSILNLRRVMNECDSTEVIRTVSEENARRIREIPELNGKHARQ